MPNYCSNNVKIYCKSRADLDKILDAIRGKGLGKVFIPWSKAVQADWDLEVKYGWANGKEERLEKYGREDPFDRKEDGYKEYPYKQLRHGWQHDNRGSKWDVQEDKNWMPDIWEEDNGNVYCEFAYESARTPHLPLRQKVSEVIGCRVELSFDEPGCEFSGEYIWEDGELIQKVDYDDGYYGNGKRCCTCGGVYDNSNPDDWRDEHHTVCIYCGEDLEDKREQNECNTSERKS